MSKPINFEFQEFGDITVVALDSKFSDYNIHTVDSSGKLVMQIPEKTIKDCRYIDGCVYFHLGHVSDSVMTDLIEKFQKLKKEKGWKPSPGLMMPNNKIKI